MLRMHSIIRDVLYADFPISFRECRFFLKAVSDELFETGKSQSYIKELYGIAKRAMEIIDVDDSEGFYLFLEKVAKSVVVPEYDAEELRGLVKRMEEVKKDVADLDSSSEALLIFYRSVAYRNKKTFLVELKKAIEMFQVIDAENIHKWFMLQYVQCLELFKNQQYTEMLQLCGEMRKRYEILNQDHGFEYVTILNFWLLAHRLQAIKENRTFTEEEYAMHIETIKAADLEILHKNADKNTDFEGFVNLKSGLEGLLLERIKASE